MSSDSGLEALVLREAVSTSLLKSTAYLSLWEGEWLDFMS